MCTDPKLNVNINSCLRHVYMNTSDWHVNDTAWWWTKFKYYTGTSVLYCMYTYFDADQMNMNAWNIFSHKLNVRQTGGATSD